MGLLGERVSRWAEEKLRKLGERDNWVSTQILDTLEWFENNPNRELRVAGQEHY